MDREQRSHRVGVYTLGTHKYERLSLMLVPRFSGITMYNVDHCSPMKSFRHKQTQRVDSVLLYPFATQILRYIRLFCTIKSSFFDQKQHRMGLVAFLKLDAEARSPVEGIGRAMQ